jgi:hypothetical protein
MAGMFRHCVVLGAILMVACPSSAPAAARKVAAVRAGCDVYNQLERRCHCAGAGNYFLGYGRKYCERSLAETGWSQAGVLWRNRTLVCLQRALSEAIPKNRAQRCDCQAIKSFAFDTHARCYTQLPTSICRLPLSDWLIATRIIDNADLLSEDGTRQIASVMATCMGQ